MGVLGYSALKAILKFKFEYEKRESVNITEEKIP